MIDRILPKVRATRDYILLAVSYICLFFSYVAYGSDSEADQRQDRYSP